MINAANLPADKLSASIITFVRFFSIPLKHELMVKIRRQALAVPSGEMFNKEALKQATTETKINTPEREVSLPAMRYRNALSMAATGAESKGVELHPKALESYAEAVDPELRDRQKDNQNHDRKKNQNEQKEENAPVKQVNINASSLEKTALERLDEKPLLNILNKLPGKNGQRWIVIPLDFSQNGRDYNISLKIFLETRAALNRAGLMALDIVGAGNLKSRMSFVAESANDKVAKLSVYSQSALTVKKQGTLKRELSDIFRVPLNNVSVKTRGDILCAGFDDDLLSSIDEVV
jgi:hypothetical protein